MAAQDGSKLIVGFEEEKNKNANANPANVAQTKTLRMTKWANLPPDGRVNIVVWSQTGFTATPNMGQSKGQYYTLKNFILHTFNIKFQKRKVIKRSKVSRRTVRLFLICSLLM